MKEKKTIELIELDEKRRWEYLKRYYKVAAVFFNAGGKDHIWGYKISSKLNLNPNPILFSHVGDKSIKIKRSLNELEISELPKESVVVFRELDFS